MYLTYGCAKADIRLYGLGLVVLIAYTADSSAADYPATLQHTARARAGRALTIGDTYDE